MANEHISEDRLTKNEFAELIQHLSLQEILTTEYRIGTNWNKLFSRKNNPTPIFFCNLCVLETSSFKNLLEHIDGRKHKLQMERVKQLYHPDYTCPKNYEKNEGIEKSSAKNEARGILSSTLDQPLTLEKKLQNTEKNKNSEKRKLDDIQNKLNCPETFKEDENQYENGKCEVVELPVQKMDAKSKVSEETSHIINSNDKETLWNVTRTAEKRLLGNNSDQDINLKKRKIVINPAAALSFRSSSIKSKEEKKESNEKPGYQTDKIIIPTVHKNKSHTNEVLPPSSLQILSNDLPKFSVKSYSSNPNENDIHGILGVEYVIKILKNRTDVSPRYECGLCELVLDGFAMQRHLEGYNHRLKFCEKHFPTAIRQYRQYMQNVPEPEIFKVMAPVLAKLAFAIEQHHGRNLPYECYERDFSLNRHEILAKAFSCRHASEQYGPTFTHVVGSTEIDELINNRHKYLPVPFSRTAIFDNNTGSTGNNCYKNSSTIDKNSNSRDRRRHAAHESTKSQSSTYKSYMSSTLDGDMCPPSSFYRQRYNTNDHHVDDETYNLMVDDFLKGTLKGFPRKNTLRDNRKRSPLPARNRKSLSPLRQNDIWQAYRHMVDQELCKLDDRFKLYRKDPEAHPSYNEEWQMFWKRRKDELVLAGLDHRNYNYQPEWVRFVKIRIEEFYGQEFENLKIKCRERLCLPLSNEHILDVKYHVQSKKISSVNEMITEPPTTISKPLTSLLTSTPQVVSVLRLMTALEDSLGSLGPKIIDLLSKALQTEKTNPLHVNAIILNKDNCSLIETAKEKLKGLVITGLFEGSKKRVLNQVVNDAESLLQYAQQFKQQLSFERSSLDSSINRMQNNTSLSHEPSSVNISSSLYNQSRAPNFYIQKIQSSSAVTENWFTGLDKKELASKLAASLVAQGKTDFDPQQLQQLIAVYKLIEKKKREIKGGSSSQVSSSIKKTLSDTLSDLLKSSAYTSEVSKLSTPGALSEEPGGTQLPPTLTKLFTNNAPINSFTSGLEICNGNNYKNTTQSMANTFGASDVVANQLEHRSDFGMNLAANPQNSNISNTYNKYEKNNTMLRNLGWNLNMEKNQNFGRSNINFNQTSNWKNF